MPCRAFLLFMPNNDTIQIHPVEGREEGRADEARRMLLTMGTKRFGKPPAKLRKTIAAITEPAVFEALATRLFDVESWADLFAGL